MHQLKTVASFAFALVATVGLAGRAEAADCMISTQSVAFGNYDPLSPTPLEGVGNVAIDCSAPASFTISLGPGTAAVQQREMRSGPQAMHYNLYSDAGRMLVWGDGISGQSVSDTTQRGNYTVYGRVPARQNLPSGTYTDSVVVTVTY